MNNKKVNAKLLNHELQIIKLAVKRLQNTKFYAMILISVMLVGIFSLYPAISSLMNDVIISSTGRIATATTAPITYKSEIRGVVIHEASFSGVHDWYTVAETLSQYKIQAVYAHFLNSPIRIRPDSEWVAAIDAFHSYGIEFHVLTANLAEGPFEPEYQAWDSAGNLAPNFCPIRVREPTRNMVEFVATNYDIDGFMHDYIRYLLADMCYCPECKARFEEWLGEGTITDWTPFYPDQPRWKEYAEWRIIPVTELVRDIREWMLAINPNIEFSAAVFTFFSDCPIYWRKWMGQDVGDWIKNGYLDMVAPMMYTKQIYGASGETLESFIDADLKYMTGGTEGKIPLIALLRTDYTASPDLTPEEFKAQIDYVRSRGLDGWMIWRYGGPGDSSDAPDIRDYLSILDMPDVFSLENIQVSTTSTSTTITWATDLPATSTVEYSTSHLFNASWESWRGDFNYWDINHINGTVVQDNTPVTDHSITLTGLSLGTQYYFRVQSQDSSGTATSKVLTFTTG